MSEGLSNFTGSMAADAGGRGLGGTSLSSERVIGSETAGVNPVTVSGSLNRSPGPTPLYAYE